MIHKTAIIDPSANISSNVKIEDGVRKKFSFFKNSIKKPPKSS